MFIRFNLNPITSVNLTFSHSGIDRTRRRRVVGILILFLTVSLSPAQIATPGLNSSTNPSSTGNRTPSVPIIAAGLAGADFSMSITPTTIRHVSGQIDSATVFLSSLNGFSGVVTLSVLGELRTYNLNDIVLGAGAAASVTITFLDEAAPGGILTEVILGRSAPIVHSVSITIISRPSVICIAPDGASSCDETPSIVSGPSPSPNSQLRVAVVLDGSPPEPFYGFDITVLTNHTILKPAGFDLTGSILQDTLPVLVDCIGGVSKNRIVCSSTDTLDTLEIAAIGRSPSLGYPGLLFTAVYNVTGVSPDTPILFQVGCTNTSVEGGACVTIASGTPFPITEGVQSGGFSNQPFFALNASPALLSIQRSNSDFSTLTISGLNNFSGNITVSTKLSSTGLTADVSPASLLLSPDFPNELSFVTLTVGNDVPPGNYSLTVAATSGVFSQSVILALTVPTPDFIIFTITNGSIVNAGDVTTSFLDLASVAGFAGTVSLALISSKGLNASLNPTSFTLSVGDAVESTLIATPMAQGTLQANITATSGHLIHSITVGVNVAGFSLFSFDYPALTLLEGSARGIEVDIHPSNVAFKGNVTLTESETPSIGLSVTCSPETFVLNKTYLDALAFCRMFGSIAGNYTVTITGTSRFLTNSLRLQVFVVQSQPILIRLDSQHHLSLARQRDTAVFVAGIYNPNKSATLYAIVRVLVENPNDASYAVSAQSALITLPPLTSRLNIQLSVALRPSTTGRLNFIVEIHWWSGELFTPEFLISNTVGRGISNTGNFLVTP